MNQAFALIVRELKALFGMLRTVVLVTAVVAAGIAGAPLGVHGDSTAPAICVGGAGGDPQPRNPGSFLDQDFAEKHVPASPRRENS